MFVTDADILYNSTNEYLQRKFAVFQMTLVALFYSGLMSFFLVGLGMHYWYRTGHLYCCIFSIGDPVTTS